MVTSSSSWAAVDAAKARLLRHLIGLKEPATGEIIYDDVNFTRADPQTRELMLRRFGILYQSGALWSSMTLAENIGLPLGEFTDLTPSQIREIAALKLALVGLGGFEDFYPERDQRRHAKASGTCTRYGSGSRDPLLRRTLCRPRSDQLQLAR